MNRLRNPKNPHWGVDFSNMAYEGGGTGEWTQYYRTKFGARISMIWNKYFSSYGGTTNLFPVERKHH